MLICTKEICDAFDSSYCHKECKFSDWVVCPHCGEEYNLRQADEVGQETYACIQCESYFDLEEME